MWLGRVAALIEAQGMVTESATFKVASDNLGTVLHSQNVQAITAVLHRALARAELAAPAAARGGIHSSGGAFLRAGRCREGLRQREVGRASHRPVR
jgi:hypothetical protein